MILLGLGPGMVWADDGRSPQELSDAEKCLLQQFEKASGDTSLAQIRGACAVPAPQANPVEERIGAEPRPAVVTRRMQEEALDFDRKYAITSHRPSYLLPLTYSQHRPTSSVYTTDDGEVVPPQKSEVKYQFSFKVPLYLDVFGSGGSLFGAYTQRSFWQMYNNKISKPFRETNYEPEIWYQYPVARPFLGWNFVTASIGINHQSNGRSQQDLSRSWNRIMGNLIFERDDYALMLRPWWRLPENRSDDDNPDIGHYMGSFDLTIGRKFGQHSFDLMLRNNLKRRDNRGAIQLGWSFPLPVNKYLRGYLQVFSGYGESLMDYNVKQNSIGAGVMLADW
ncbi:phospholipase A [Uliginosibacterium paludis]|uniref:Phospholipase A1 n=2 Tax=Uliginosibacterium paludis TaxID=1615952 RepID=A0ABV2CS22_9RHOO